jgi:hypothetical protein
VQIDWLTTRAGSEIEDDSRTVRSLFETSMIAAQLRPQVHNGPMVGNLPISRMFPPGEIASAKFAEESRPVLTPFPDT